MSERKLTDPLLTVRGVSQRAVKFLADSLKGAELVRIRVSPYRPLMPAALILHAVLSRKGYTVETSPVLASTNSLAAGKGEVAVEFTVSNRTSPKTCAVQLRTNSQAERHVIPYSPAAQLFFLMVAEELTVLPEEAKVIGEATVLQHELVPQSSALVEILKGLGVQSLSSKFLSFVYSRNFTIVDSLVSTLKPFLPGITLEDPSRVSEELASRGVDPRESVHDMDEQRLKRVIDYVAEKVSTWAKVPVQYPRVFPSVYASESVNRREYDLRLLAGMLDVMVEVNPQSIVTAAMSGDLRVLEASFNCYASRLKSLFKSVSQSRAIIISGARVLVLEDLDLPLPLSYIKDNLVLYGVLQSEDMIIVKRGSAKTSNCFILASPSKIQVRNVSLRGEWCFYDLESEELQRIT